jgi:lysophospholipase L1-like esterase
MNPKRPPRKPTPPAPYFVRHRIPLAAGALLLVLVVWGLWPDASVANLDSRGATIIAFGDSLTSGFGAAEGEDYPARLAELIGQPVVNAGRSGDTTESALERIEPAVLARDPRIVIVGLGGNDFLRSEPIATTESNLRSIVRKIHDAGAMVVLLGFEFPSLNANYDAMYRRIAREEECLLIPDVLDGILRDPALKSDEIHPNAAGYQLLAERVSGPAKALMKRADAARR